MLLILTFEYMFTPLVNNVCEWMIKDVYARDNVMKQGEINTVRHVRQMSPHDL